MGRILVVGGGYAGVLAALRAAKWAAGRAEVMLVSAREDFVERIRLHERAARGRRVSRSLRSLLPEGVMLRIGEVRSIDLAARAVRIDDELIFYDRLILAIGSIVELDQVPGARQFAMPIDPLAIDAFCQIETPREVVICGGGLSGIETAADLAEANRHVHVTLVTQGPIGALLSEAGRQVIRAHFARLGVSLLENAKISAVEADAVVTSAGRVPSSATLWATGFVAPPLLRQIGLAVNSRGQCYVDPMLRALGHDDVFVVGDAACMNESVGSPVAMGCKTAMPLGAHAGRNAVDSLVGNELRPFRFRDSVLCLSLGRSAGLVQEMAADGTPTERVLSGRLAAWVKELINRYTLLSLALERRGLFDYRWPKMLPAVAPRPLLGTPDV